MTEEISLKDVQDQVDTLVEEFGGYWEPLAMLASITEELGEIAREINHLEGIKPKKPTETPSKIGEELADLLFSVVCVANHYKVDLTESFEKVLKKYQHRDSKRFIK